MSFRLSSVPSLHERLNREAPHTLAVVLFTDGDWYGYGVVEGSTGNGLAWDGMYSSESLPDTTPLDRLAWDEWDDMASKLVFNEQAPWLAGHMGFWLMPTYDVSWE